MKLFDVVLVLDTELMRMRGSEDDYLFRIEILKERASDRFSAKVWLQECCEVQLSYPERPDGQPLYEPLSRRLLIEEEEMSWQIGGNSVDEVLDQLLKRLNERYEPSE